MMIESGSQRWGLTAGALLAVGLLLGCSPIPSSPRPAGVPDRFSGDVARAHLDSLGGLIPRAPGSEGDERARRYLTREFERSGAEVRLARDADQRHLIAEVAGESADVLLLVAPYPAFERDWWIGDSGAALLLEIARVLSRESPRYTLRFALAEARPASLAPGLPGHADADTDRVWRPVDSSESAQLRIDQAGASLARALAAEGDLASLRAIFVFDTSARPDLRIARDLRSHPVYRDVFWESAAALGFQATFPPDADWSSPRGLHVRLRAASTDRLLALVDEARARPDLVPGPVGSEASTQSLESVGVVSVEALGRIMRRLARIDAFAPRPIEAATPGQASPQTRETPPSS